MREITSPSSGHQRVLPVLGRVGRAWKGKWTRSGWVDARRGGWNGESCGGAAASPAASPAARVTHTGTHTARLAALQREGMGAKREASGVRRLRNPPHLPRSEKTSAPADFLAHPFTYPRGARCETRDARSCQGVAGGGMEWNGMRREPAALEVVLREGRHVRVFGDDTSFLKNSQQNVRSDIRVIHHTPPSRPSEENASST